MRGYDGQRRARDAEGAALQARARAAICAAGGPLFAPAGKGFAHWRIRGWAWEAGNMISTFVHVEKREGRRARIETRYEPEPDPEPEAVFVRQVIDDAVTFDFCFPLTPVVNRSELVIPVDRSSSTIFTVYSANEVWTAVARIGDRSIEVRSFGIPPEDFALRTIDEIDALPDERWF